MFTSLFHSSAQKFISADLLGLASFVPNLFFLDHSPDFSVGHNGHDSDVLPLDAKGHAVIPDNHNLTKGALKALDLIQQGKEDDLASLIQSGKITPADEADARQEIKAKQISAKALTADLAGFDQKWITAENSPQRQIETAISMFSAEEQTALKEYLDLQAQTRQAFNEMVKLKKEWKAAIKSGNYDRSQLEAQYQMPYDKQWKLWDQYTKALAAKEKQAPQAIKDGLNPSSDQYLALDRKANADVALQVIENEFKEQPATVMQTMRDSNAGKIVFAAGLLATAGGVALGHSGDTQNNGVKIAFGKDTMQPASFNPDGTIKLASSDVGALDNADNQIAPEVAQVKTGIFAKIKNVVGKVLNFVNPFSATEAYAADNPKVTVKDGIATIKETGGTASDAAKLLGTNWKKLLIKQKDGSTFMPITQIKGADKNAPIVHVGDEFQVGPGALQKEVSKEAQDDCGGCARLTPAEQEAAYKLLTPCADKDGKEMIYVEGLQKALNDPNSDFVKAVNASNPHCNEIAKVLGRVQTAGFAQNNPESIRVLIAYFQWTEGLKIDGVVGPKTKAKLATLTDKAACNSQAPAEPKEEKKAPAPTRQSLRVPTPVAPQLGDTYCDTTTKPVETAMSSAVQAQLEILNQGNPAFNLPVTNTVEGNRLGLVNQLVQKALAENAGWEQIKTMLNNQNFGITTYDQQHNPQAETATIAQFNRGNGDYLEALKKYVAQYDQKKYEQLDENDKTALCEILAYIIKNQSLTQVQTSLPINFTRDNSSPNKVIADPDYKTGALFQFANQTDALLFNQFLQAVRNEIVLAQAGAFNADSKQARMVETLNKANGTYQKVIIPFLASKEKELSAQFQQEKNSLQPKIDARTASWAEKVRYAEISQRLAQKNVLVREHYLTMDEIALSLGKDLSVLALGEQLGTMATINPFKWAHAAWERFCATLDGTADMRKNDVVNPSVYRGMANSDGLPIWMADEPVNEDYLNRINPSAEKAFHLGENGIGVLVTKTDKAGKITSDGAFTDKDRLDSTVASFKNGEVFKELVKHLDIVSVDKDFNPVAKDFAEFQKVYQNQDSEKARVLVKAFGSEECAWKAYRAMYNIMHGETSPYWSDDLGGFKLPKGQIVSDVLQDDSADTLILKFLYINWLAHLGEGGKGFDMVSGGGTGPTPPPGPTP